MASVNVEMLAAGGCIVDVILVSKASIDQREQVITDMYLAGYKLRDEQLSTLTFLKELDT